MTIVGKQFAEITAISSYSFVVTLILLFILKYIPGMHLRVTEEAEMRGLDLDQFFDEQIGESWELFDVHEGRHNITHGVPSESLPVSNAVTQEREAAKTEKQV